MSDGSPHEQRSKGFQLRLAVPTWLAPVLLGLLIVLHVGLAARYHTSRGHFPGQLIHAAYSVVIDQARFLDGYAAVSPSTEDGQDAMTIFDGSRETEPLLSDSSALREALTHGWLRGLWRSEGYWNEPSLSFFLPALLHALSGHRIEAAVLTPQLFLALTLLSVYGIGRRAGGPWTGLAAAAIASGYPGIVELAYTHHDSMATGAMAIAVVCLLQYSDGFTRLWASALGGIALFVSSCVGESVAGFMLVCLIVAGPLLVEWIRFALRIRGGWRRVLRAVAGQALFAAPLVLWFDGGRIGYFRTREGEAWGEMSARATIGSHVPEFLDGPLGLLAYFFEITFDFVQPLMTLWLIAGAVLLYRAPRGGRVAMMLSVAVPLVLLSVMPKKASWYILPILPSLAVLTALGLRGWRTGRMRTRMLGAAAACGIATALFYSLAPPAWHSRLDADRISPSIKSTVNVCGLSGGFNWQRMAVADPMADRIVTVGPDLVALDRARAPHARETRLVAVYGAFSYPIEGLRYVLELSEPELFVIDFINPLIKPETRMRMLDQMGDAHFEYLIILNERGGLRPLPPDNWDPLLSRMDWMNGQSLTPQPERDTILRDQARSLLHRPWERVELSAGPAYVAVDDHDGHDKMPTARSR